MRLSRGIVLTLVVMGSMRSGAFEITAIDRDGGPIRWQPAEGLAYTVELRAAPIGAWGTATSADGWPIAGTRWSDPSAPAVAARFYRVRGEPDGMALVPAGTFAMGDAYGLGDPAEVPVHEVYVSAFRICRTEVTNRQVADLLQWAYDRGLVTATAATVSNVEGDPRELVDLDGEDCQVAFSGGQFTVDPGKDEHPCLEISWYGAVAYGNYRSDREALTRCVDLTDWTLDPTADGYRLPTEAEWEKAARGGLPGHYYPWSSSGGDYANHIVGDKANYWQSGDRWENGGGSPETAPVGSYEAWGYGDGLHDMAGNLWEWCWDRHSGTWYGDPRAVQPDPAGPAIGPSRVARGGSWINDTGSLRCAHRGYASPSFAGDGVGFRCVRRPGGEDHGSH